MSTCQALDIQALRSPLTGVQVQVRPFTNEDISEAYVSWLRDPDVVRFSSQRFQNHTLETCQSYLASFKNSSNHFLAICDRISGSMLGTLTVYRNLNHGTADIGIMVGERQIWGKGIGAEAFCLVISALKTSGAIRKITAGTLAVNYGMVRIMEKAGMRHEATRHAQELINEQPVDMVYYAFFCYD